jgi:hypothetical protein
MTNYLWHRKDVPEFIFAGRCVACGNNTFFDKDGNAEPGGDVDIEHLAYPLIASDWGFTGKPVAQCYLCNNDQARHEQAVKIAKTKWSKA